VKPIALGVATAAVFMGLFFFPKRAAGQVNWSDLFEDEALAPSAAKPAKPAPRPAAAAPRPSGRSRLHLRRNRRSPPQTASTCTETAGRRPQAASTCAETADRRAQTTSSLSSQTARQAGTRGRRAASGTAETSTQANLAARGPCRSRSPRPSQRRQSLRP